MNTPRRWIFIWIIGALLFSGRLWANAFVVSSTNDSGPGTLRQAILDANANIGPDSITFSVSGTILNTTPMPEITDDETTIDAAGQTITVQASVITFPPPIVLDSSNNIIRGFRITGYTGDDGLSISDGANGNLISQMVLNGNAQGLRIGGNNNQVEGCFIGTDGTGTAAIPNSFAGVILQLGATGNTIGGTTPAERNIISGNGGNGIQLNGASGNVIQGNFIGMDATGTTVLANDDNGIELDEFVDNSQDNLIGGDVGTTPGGPCTGACNLISGNLERGILIEDETSTGNQILGNFIGTDVTGDLDRGNDAAGISLTDAPNNTIGGTTPAARNIISGNGDVGIEIMGGTANGNTVQGNFIGTNAAGNAALGNDNSGVFLLSGADGNIVGGIVGVTPGGSCSGACNLISSNSYGVYLSDTGGGIADTIIQGNFIGTDINGSQNLGNGLDGVRIAGSNNTIGGTTPEAMNRIAFNGSDGVEVFSGAGNAVWGNSIFMNFALGISLNLGAGNHDQPAPVLNSVTSNGCDTTLLGTLNSPLNPNAQFRIEFFSNPPGDPDEGRTFLGFADIMTDGMGIADFEIDLPTAVVAGQFVTATATVTTAGPNLNDSSEFSTGVEVTGTTANPGTVQFSSAIYSVAEDGGMATITVTRTGGSDCPISADFSTMDGTATAGLDYLAASGTLNWADGDSGDKTFSVPILDDGLVEGEETVDLALSNPGGGASLGTPDMAVLTILEDDTPIIAPNLFAGGTGCHLAATSSFPSGGILMLLPVLAIFALRFRL